MRANEIIIRAEQRPGEASFYNYNEIREYLDAELLAYRSKEYSLANFREAETDLRVLRAVKKKLYNKKKELETAYKMPIKEVIRQLDELIDMVKEPMNILDRFIKNHEKDIKEQRIYEYAEQKGTALGKYAEKVINSPAFFNPRWRNKTYYDSVWKRDVDIIFRNAISQIETILATGGEHKNALLAFYFEKLSMEGMGAFYETLTKGVEDEKTQIEGKPLYNEISGKPYTIDPETGEILYPDIEEEKESFPMGVGDLRKDVTESEQQIVSKTVQISGPEKQVKAYIDAADGYGVQIQELKQGGAFPKIILDDSKSIKGNRKQNVNRAGVSWTEEEDRQLRKEFERGDGISTIADVHERSKGAIQSRLAKLGLEENLSEMQKRERLKCLQYLMSKDEILTIINEEQERIIKDLNDGERGHINVIIEPDSVLVSSKKTEILPDDITPVKTVVPENERPSNQYCIFKKDKIEPESSPFYFFYNGESKVEIPIFPGMIVYNKRLEQGTVVSCDKRIEVLFVSGEGQSKEVGYNSLKEFEKDVTFSNKAEGGEGQNNRIPMFTRDEILDIIEHENLEVNRFVQQINEVLHHKSNLMITDEIVYYYLQEKGYMNTAGDALDFYSLVTKEGIRAGVYKAMKEKDGIRHYVPLLSDKIQRAFLSQLVDILRDVNPNMKVEILAFNKLNKAIDNEIKDNNWGPKKDSCNICKYYLNGTCGALKSETCEDYFPTPQSFKGEPGAYGDATRFRLGGYSYWY